jgi:ribosome biogenesis GTPase
MADNPLPREGRVIVNFSRHVLVQEDSGTRVDCQIRGRKLAPVAGDRVRFSIQRSGFGVIDEVLPRRSVLERHDPNKRAAPLAANVDRMCIVVAPVPAPEPYLIDKYTVAAALLGIEPVVVMNKMDLADGEDPALRDALDELLADYSELGLKAFSTSAADGRGIEALRAALAGVTSIVVGPSGVGKSSLVKRLVPDLDLRVGEISRASGEGKHTTTRTTLFDLPGGGSLLDSPGVRDFYLWPMPLRDLARGFVEFAVHAARCKFADCTHRSEPRCAVRDAVESEALSAQRYESYLGLARIMERQFVAWEKP